MEAQVQALLSQLSLEEKVMLTVGDTFWSTSPIERLAIPSIYMTDGPHGVRKQLGEGIASLNESVPATCFPTASAMASSWDTDLVEQVGRALGDECLALDVQILLGPGLNIKRTPLCGRNFEYYAEDPVLTGEIGSAFVRGVQSRGVGTSAKHYAVNNQEFERMTMSAEVDPRTLREIYLAGFERVVKQTSPWTVMAAYNRINGVPAPEHHELLRQILKSEWGFQGAVVSDWGAVSDRAAALAAGTDLEMPGMGGLGNERLVQLVKDGLLPEAVIDEAVARILRLTLQAATNRRPGATFDVDSHHALARRVAAESAVLLKNDGNLLPLRVEQLRSAAVIGRFAKTPPYQGGGSSQLTPTRLEAAYDHLAERLQGKVHLRYADGYPPEDRTDEDLLHEAVEAARTSDVAVIFAGLYQETEGGDRQHLDLPPAHCRLIEAVCRVQPDTVVVLHNGSAVAMPWVAGPKAILEGWLGGQATGAAMADLLLGEANPSGKLAETFPVRLADTPAYINYPGDEDRVRYGEGLFVGYRYYDRTGVAPLFAFGHGLSYTTFAYSDLRLSREALTDRDTLEVTVTVRNTGKYAGKEIVQVYVRDLESRLVRPVKELKAFAKVRLEPGEAKAVRLTLQPRDFACWDSRRCFWYTESGDFEILVGSASDQIRLRAGVTMHSAQHPPEFTLLSPVKHLLADPAARAMLVDAFAATPGGAMLTHDMIVGLIGDFPLRKLVQMLGVPISDDQVSALLARINQAVR
ncbi:MAG TPA: glycoside hydrolase family 3 C-terminal domain-containing protein [Symbiobacteriaceae bacterium]|nr:glycoside hydrolase family 3 C-terminal domain-containing protein [Symbiobacteriaceae bacterium]